MFDYSILQLGVQIIEICLATRERNGGKSLLSISLPPSPRTHTTTITKNTPLPPLSGVSKKINEKVGENLIIINFSIVIGLMSFEELRRRVLATSGKTRQDVTEDDLARAIKKLRVLGGGFAVIPIGKHRLVQSVPGELNMDHKAVLQKAEVCWRVWVGVPIT